MVREVDEAVLEAPAVSAVDAPAPAKTGLARVRSLLAMYAIHGLNLVLPLATLPVITRLLGPQEYGRYGVLINWSAMALILIEFGMGIGATKAISGQNEPTARRALGRVLVHQTLNALLVLPVVGLVARLWMKPAPSPLMIVLMLATAWSLGLTTLWFRVARANVPRLLPASLAAKLGSLVIIVGCLPIWPSLTIALAGNLASSSWPVLDAWFVRREVMQAVREFSWADWRKNLRESFPVPAQRLGSGLYLLLPATLVASFFGMKVAGWYVLSDRLIRAGTGLFQPLASTLFPLQIEVRGLPRDAPARKRLRRYLAGTIGASVFASVFTCALADFGVRLIGGDAFAPAAVFLRWMSPSLFFITVNMVLVNQLYVQDREGVIARAVWVCGLLFSAVMFFFGNHSPAFFGFCCMAVEGLLALWLLFAWYSIARREPALPAAADASAT